MLQYNGAIINELYKQNMIIKITLFLIKFSLFLSTSIFYIGNYINNLMSVINNSSPS
jgi:hypothetical protein